MAKWYQKLMSRGPPPIPEKILAIPTASEAAPPGRPANCSPTCVDISSRSCTCIPRPANTSGGVLMAKKPPTGSTVTATRAVIATMLSISMEP